MKRRLIILLAVIAVVLAACGSSGDPESFDDQPGPLPTSIAGFATQLIGNANPDAVPLVERNHTTRLAWVGTTTAGSCGFDQPAHRPLADDASRPGHHNRAHGNTMPP